MVQPVSPARASATTVVAALVAVTRQLKRPRKRETMLEAGSGAQDADPSGPGGPRGRGRCPCAAADRTKAARRNELGVVPRWRASRRSQLMVGHSCARVGASTRSSSIRPWTAPAPSVPGESAGRLG